MDYRSLPFISNSDLTDFKNYLFDYKVKKPEKAFAFGTAVHAHLMEPKTAHPLPTTNLDTDLIRYLVDQTRNNAFCKWMLRFAQKEKMTLFRDPDTGLACKSKLDTVYKNRLIVDFKTTSALDYRRFLESCVRYDYDRQAAFYLDSIGANRFIFIGIQKVEPYDLFYFEATKARGFVESGRKKYKALLRAWKHQNYRPESWGKERQAA